MGPGNRPGIWAPSGRQVNNISAFLLGFPIPGEIGPDRVGGFAVGGRFGRSGHACDTRLA